MSTFVGEAILDEKFDPTAETVQKALKNFCRELRKTSFIVPGSAKCWFEEFDSWLRLEKDKKIPVEEDEFYPFLLEWVKDNKEGER